VAIAAKRCGILFRNVCVREDTHRSVGPLDRLLVVPFELREEVSRVAFPLRTARSSLPFAVPKFVSVIVLVGECPKEICDRNVGFARDDVRVLVVVDDPSLDIHPF